MGMPRDTSVTDPAAPQSQPQPFLDATYNPRDIKKGTPSAQDAAILWGEKAPADDWRQEVNDRRAATTAEPPANPDGAASADSAVSADTADSTAPYDAAAKRVKTRNAQTCAQAALMLNAQGGGEQVPDQALADYFHVPLPVVTESREKFRYAYDRNKNRQALAGCPVLSSTIVQNPGIAPLMRSQIAPLATMEQTLSTHTSVRHDIANAILGMFGFSSDGGYIGGSNADEALKAFAGFSNDVLKTVSLAASAPLVAVDWLNQKLGGEDPMSRNTRGLAETWFGATTDKAEENSSYFKYDPTTGFGGKVSHGIGGFVGMLPYIYLTGGESAAVRLLPRLAQNAGRMAIPAATEGVNTANDVYADTGSGIDAAKAGAMVTATTAAQGIVPLSLAGRTAFPMITAAPLGIAVGEASRRLNNAALPDDMQQPFNLEDAGVNGILSSLTAGLAPHPHQKALIAVDNMARLGIIGEAANTPLRESHPALFRQLLRDMSHGSDLKTLYVDGKTFREIMGRNNISMDELAAKMPDVAKQIDDAIRNDGYVSMPVEEYATYMAGSPMDADILKNFKSMPDPEAMTAGQAQEVIQQANARIKEEAAAQIEGKDRADAFRQSQDAVEQSISARLNEIGRFSPEDNRDIARVQTAILSRIAAAEKITPEAAYEKYGANVRRESAGDAQATFLQENDYRRLRVLMSEMRESHPEVFRSPRSAGKTMAEILDDHLGKNGWKELSDFFVKGHEDATDFQKGEAFKREENPTYDGNTNKWYWIRGEKGPDGKDRSNYIIQHLHDGDGLTHWLNIAAAKQGSGGSRIYTALGDYANNTRKVFDADPHGLTENSRLRRTVNMMNIAIRHGTTRWINPGEQQKLDWKENLLGKNNEEADLHNFKVLVDSVIKQVETALPETKEVYYDFERRGFYDEQTGKRLGKADFELIAADSGAARAAKIGTGTIRQAIILKSLLQAGHDRGRGLRTLQALLDGDHLLHGAGEAFYQEGIDGPHPDSRADSEPRGSYDPQTRTIALLKSADASTPYHETGHWALDTYARIAADPAASPRLRADMNAVLKWMGVKDLAAWNGMTLEAQRPYHERFARAFETYLMEGKAPTPQLQSVFQRIKNLLLEIYRSRKAGQKELGPDIRRVMDRMLGGEDAGSGVADARHAATPAPTGHPLLDAEQWTEYQKELLGMSPENRSMAERFADKLRDYHAAVAEYVTLEDSHGGKVLNTDIARELSPDYLKDRTRSGVVHTLASAFVRRMYAEKLESIEHPNVYFTAGGPGAGKSTVLGKIPDLSKDSSQADIVYDTTMSYYDSAKGMIEQALNADGAVRVAFIIRDPEESLVEGAIRRVKEEAREFGSGRPVSISYFIQAHRDATGNIFKLAREYEGRPDVRFKFIDNTRGEHNAKEVSLEQAKKIVFEDTAARVRAALDKEYKDGRISEKIYKSFEP